IRRILASDEENSSWSRRAVEHFDEIRNEHPWVSADATTIVRQPKGEVRWWTFAGGVANALLADSLKSEFDVKGDNLSLSFPAASSLEIVSASINRLVPDSIRAIPNPDAMDNLKFSECLPADIAAEVFVTRFDDREGVRQAVEEKMRLVVDN
ncbi:MAG: hypothetical protein RJP95_02940, partial [Pirellulales bacterium]